MTKQKINQLIAEMQERNLLDSYSPSKAITGGLNGYPEPEIGICVFPSVDINKGDFKTRAELEEFCAGKMNAIEKFLSDKGLNDLEDFSRIIAIEKDGWHMANYSNAHQAKFDYFAEFDGKDNCSLILLDADNYRDREANAISEVGAFDDFFECEESKQTSKLKRRLTEKEEEELKKETCQKYCEIVSRIAENLHVGMNLLEGGLDTEPNFLHPLKFRYDVELARFGFLLIESEGEKSDMQEKIENLENVLK